MTLPMGSRAFLYKDFALTISIELIEDKTMNTLYLIIENGKQTFFNDYAGKPMDIGLTLVRAIDKAKETGVSITDAMPMLDDTTNDGSDEYQLPRFMEEPDGHYSYFTWDSGDSGYGHSAYDQYFCYDIDRGIIKHEGGARSDTMLKDGEWTMPRDIRTAIIQLTDPGGKAPLQLRDLADTWTRGYLTHKCYEQVPAERRFVIQPPFIGDLTPMGRHDWADLFTAEIAISEQRHHREPLYITNSVSIERLEAYKNMKEGNCNIEDHVKWVEEDAWAMNVKRELDPERYGSSQTAQPRMDVSL